MNSNHIRKPFFSKDLTLVGVAAASLLGACFLNLQTTRPELVLTKQDTALNINNKFLVMFSGGHKRLITDLLWIQTLIESDTEHYKKKDLNSWLFLRFNTISVLDPKFYENYSYGGQFLSIVKDDLEGANVIYGKGLTYFPDDYLLNYQAGFMNYYEMGDFKTGIKYLSRVQDNPRAPTFLKSIINKLKFEVSGDLDTTFKLVKFSYETTKDENLKERLWTDLYAIKAEKDLKCLNNSGSGCETKDLEEEPYQKRGDLFHSAKQFKPYKIKIRGERKLPPHEGFIDTIK